jgi:hypothetical protein
MAEVSNLLKIARAVGAGGEFSMRVEAACNTCTPPVPFTTDLLWKVAAACAGSIELSGEDGMKVDTTGVTDDQITAAVQGDTPAA